MIHIEIFGIWSDQHVPKKVNKNFIPVEDFIFGTPAYDMPHMLTTSKISLLLSISFQYQLVSIWDPKFWHMSMFVIHPFFKKGQFISFDNSCASNMSPKSKSSLKLFCHICLLPESPLPGKTASSCSSRSCWQGVCAATHQ